MHLVSVGRDCRASTHDVGRRTACTRISTGTCPWGKVLSMSTRHTLDQPSQIIQLFIQGSDAGFNLFINLLLCQNACCIFRVGVAVMGVQEDSSFGTVGFSQLFCYLRERRIFYRSLIENWHAS